MNATHTRICSVNDCERRHRRNGLCEMHDSRMKRTGTTDSPIRSLADRFWSKVDKNGPTIRPSLGPCWVWTAATKDGGYGVMRPAGRRSGPTVKAHRVSAELAGMDIEGRFVLHACDNPPCVNPDHLRPGGPMENVRDMVSRERISRGETSGSNKLTEAEVQQIRRLASDGMYHREIAVLFGVSRTNVTRIVNREGWAHVA